MEKAICSLLTIGLFCFTQINSQANFVSAGGNGTGSGGSFSATIGQIDYNSFSGSGGSVAQGNQQAFEIFEASSITLSSIKITASIYPNPSEDFIKILIKEEDLKDLSLKLADINGKEILTIPINENETIVDVEMLSSGTYFLTIYQNEPAIKSFKLIKN